MKKIIFALTLLLLLTGCATQTDVASGDQAGFLFGLWNGISLSFAFIGSLFSENILVYYPLNNGGWYDWGFVIGIGIWWHPIWTIKLRGRW